MMRRSSFLTVLFCLTVFLFSACSSVPSNGITQVATIDALLTGVYDGHMSLETLRSYGDFGLGTFEGLDGEMILLDGTFYKVRADGKVYEPALSERTPFACVTSFEPDRRETISERADLAGLEKKIDALAPGPNRFCTFIIRGTFDRVKTRSVPAQQRPYPPLVEVARSQPVFHLSNVRGTLIGFRSPAFVKGVNVPGYHMHFLAEDLSGGGHVLDLVLREGVLEADTVHDWLSIYLPIQNPAFAGADLSVDRSRETQAVEK